MLCYLSFSAVLCGGSIFSKAYSQACSTKPEKVTGQCKETKWYRIEFNGKVGYVSDSYIIAEKPDITYTYEEYTDPFNIWTCSVYKDSANVYDEPSSSGNVIDTFGYKHLMLVVGKCKETGWYKVIYDDEICAESNYQNHWKVVYDYTSMKPAISPDDETYIIFSRTAKNVKTGYINPKLVMYPQEWEKEIYHKWNGIKIYEYYSMSEESLDYFKRLCYAEPLTIVEGEGFIGMFIPDPDAPSKRHEGQSGTWNMFDDASEMLDEYIKERGYYADGGGGGWIDSDAQAYHVYADFLNLEEQYCEVDISGGRAGYKINWEYFNKTYGYTQDAVWTCMSYVTSSICDKSIGIWNEEEGTVTYNIEEAAQICKIVEEFLASDIGKLPSIREIRLHTIGFLYPEGGGGVYGYYYLYMSTDDEDTLAELDRQLYQRIENEFSKRYTYEERVYSYGMYQEGEVFIKELFCEELYNKETQ